MTGTDLKERGMRQALDAANVAWRQRFAAEFDLLARSGVAFTVEWVLTNAGDPPATGSRNAIGAAMNAGVSRWPNLKRIGYVAATRPSRHCGVIAEWQLV